MFLGDKEQEVDEDAHEVLANGVTMMLAVKYDLHINASLLNEIVDFCNNPDGSKNITKSPSSISKIKSIFK